MSASVAPTFGAFKMPRTHFAGFLNFFGTSKINFVGLTCSVTSNISSTNAAGLKTASQLRTKISRVICFAENESIPRHSKMELSTAACSPLKPLAFVKAS